MTEAMRADLDRPFNATEVRNALFQTRPNKSLGPGGYSSYFYQSQWDVIGDSMSRLCL